MHKMFLGYSGIYLLSSIRSLFFYSLIAIGFAALLMACGMEEPQKLEFVTIERGDAPDQLEQYWQSVEPGLLIIAQERDLEEARPYITDAAITALGQMNFNTHFAIVAFRGRQRSYHENFQIERVVRWRGEIQFYAEPGRLSGQSVPRSPYHVIKLPKEGRWGQVFTFKLYFDDEEQEVTSLSYRIP